MDVTCDRCKAEYEFDEALLGERGTTVKCSACGHVFRVLPPSREAVRSALQLRYARDGSLRSLGSLRELQQRIRAGEVGLDDELGRDGFPFRALRDVPELKNFFLAQPGRHEQSTVVADPTYPAHDPGASRMPVHPESVSPGPLEPSADMLESEPPEASTIPPPLPGTPEREAADARRREAAARAAPAPQSTGEPDAPDAPQPPPARPATGGTIPAPAGVPPEQRPPSFRHGTMSGVGPSGQLPPPPRMPELGPKPARAPVPTTPAPTPAGENPHASTLPPPGTGTVSGLPGLRPHQTHYGTANGLPSLASTAHGIPPGSTHPLANRLSSERPLEVISSGQTSLPAPQPPTPSGQVALPPSPPRSASIPPVQSVPLPKPLVEPDRFPQFKSVPSPIPSAPNGGPPQLYLRDSEGPRRGEGSSHTWLYVVLLLLAAGGGGWFGMTRMRVSGKARLDPTPAAEPATDLSAEGSPAESGETDDPAGNAGSSGAAPFAPPIPELQEELARRSGQSPSHAADHATEGSAATAREPSSSAAKPVLTEPAKSAPVEPAKPAQPAGKPAPAASGPAKVGLAAKPSAPAKPAAEAQPTAASVPAGAKNDKLARAERAASASPQDYGAQLNLADTLFAAGENDAAVEAYQKALGLRASGSEANCGMGFALLKDGKTSQSLPYFDRAASSGYAEANIGLGDAYRALGQPSSAKEAYQAYLDRLPTGARAAYARTWLDKLSGGSGGKPSERAPEPDPYRPAGELTAPTP